MLFKLKVFVEEIISSARLLQIVQYNKLNYWNFLMTTIVKNYSAFNKNQ